jgi:phosphoribosylglycinamide formyltransferase 1
MRIAILISGRGSNMFAIAEAIKSGRISNIEIEVAVSDRIEAQGLIKAKELGIETLVVERNSRNREEHDSEIVVELKQREIEIICLAGYMRLLSPYFVKSFPNKIINIHPSLLPAFPGLNAQKQAFDYGVKVSGCTVHFVDELLDHGTIIAQKSVLVESYDTAETLSEKILAEEHKLYPKVLNDLANNSFKISNRKILFD